VVPSAEVKRVTRPSPSCSHDEVFPSASVNDRGRDRSSHVHVVTAVATTFPLPVPSSVSGLSTRRSRPPTSVVDVDGLPSLSVAWTWKSRLSYSASWRPPARSTTAVRRFSASYS
jgi:hypothetical protein